MKRQATHVGSVSGMVALHGDQIHLLQLFQHSVQMVHISPAKYTTNYMYIVHEYKYNMESIDVSNNVQS